MSRPYIRALWNTATPCCASEYMLQRSIEMLVLHKFRANKFQGRNVSVARPPQARKSRDGAVNLPSVAG
jgi:hypothetical protein